MAQPESRPESKKSQLIQSLERNRQELRRHALGVRAGADIPARIRQSFARNPLAWIGGGAGTAVLLRILLGRRSGKPLDDPDRSAPKNAVSPKKFTPVRFLLKSAMELGTPLLLQWAQQKLQQFTTHPPRPQPPKKSAPPSNPSSRRT